MAVLANPYGALAAVAPAVGWTNNGTPPSAITRRPGDTCFFEGQRYPDCRYEADVIQDGQRCHIVADCDCTCHLGQLVATRCTVVSKDCEPIENDVATIEAAFPA